MTHLIDQEVVLDEEDNVIYLCSDNIYPKEEYALQQNTLKTHDKQTVSIVQKDTWECRASPL